MWIWQRFCFFFLFTVTAITIVRALRLTWWWWRRRRRASVGASPDVDGTTALRAWHRSNVARSTSGLAQAALWFNCAGAAAGLLRAGDVFGNSTRSSLAVVTDQSLYVLEATGIGFALCSLLFVAAWGFGATTQDSTALDRFLSTIGSARRLLWPMAILLTASTLFEMRDTLSTALAATEVRLLEYGIERAIGQLLSRLSVLFAAIGALTWLSVLVESAAMRRLRPA
jgi:hypothetical protein